MKGSCVHVGVMIRGCVDSTDQEGVCTYWEQVCGHRCMSRLVFPIPR